MKLGKIESGKSYVPYGLNAAQYGNIRKGQEKKKAENYAKNVVKAGIFEDYTDWYTKRGTDTKQAWAKDIEWPRPSTIGPEPPDNPSRSLEPRSVMPLERRPEPRREDSPSSSENSKQFYWR